MAKILIVDDDPDACEIAAKHLGNSGHETECMANGVDALRAIIDHTPDVIVLDLHMPEMDGINLLGVIRAYLRLQTLPVVLWTAVQDTHTLGRARHFGVSEILLKAKASLAELAAAVERALHQGAA